MRKTKKNIGTAIKAIRDETKKQCVQHWQVRNYKLEDWEIRGKWAVCKRCKKFRQIIANNKVHFPSCQACERKKYIEKMKLRNCKGFEPMRDLIFDKKDDIFYTSMTI